MLGEVFRVVFLVAVGAIMVAEWRWIARKSVTLGTIVGLGLVIRLVTGLAFFFISYLDLNFLRGLHTGGGFWVLATDAKLYYVHAVSSAVGNSVYWDMVPAPHYVRALAWWLAFTGTSVLSAILFNAVCYMATVAAIVSVRGQRDRQFVSAWLPLVVAAFSFSPLLLMTSTQALKDPFFAMLVVIACRAAFEILEYFRQSPGRGVSLLASVGIGALALGLLGGVREYYGIFLWLALAAGLVALLCMRRGLVMRRVPLVLLSISILSAWWVAFMVGVGPQYQYYSGLIARTTRLNIPILASSPNRPGTQSLTGVLQTRRDGFVMSGGATNLVRPSDSERQSNRTGDRSSVSDVSRSLVTGLLAMFVPMSLLKAASIVTFQGGRGLLFVTDADTLFIDFTLLVMAWLMIRNRASVRASFPSVLFTVALVSVSTILLAYVVTNFGTLFRLRSVMSIPAWMTPLALVATAANRAVTSGPGQSRVSAVG
jgi:hypothetical protein